MKTNKIVYWGATGLLTAMLLMSVSMYFLKHDEMVQNFGNLGFPAWLVYPLGIAKLLGLVAIITKKSVTLKEWAYAGLFFNFTLAFFAHINANDGQFAGALVALILLGLSYFFEKKMNIQTELETSIN